MLLFECWRKGKVQVAFFLSDFIPVNRRKKLYQNKKTLKANIKLHKKKANAIFSF